MKAWGAVLVAAALAAVPTGAVAKPGHGAAPVRDSATIRFRASNGYRVQVEASSGRESLVSVVVENRSVTVRYLLLGSLGVHDSLDIHLPHVGRIDVKFDPIKTTPRPPSTDCLRPRRVVTSGYFRGTIELHGERDYMTVDRKRARGRVTRSFPKPCRKSRSSSERPPRREDAAEMAQGTVLGAAKSDGSLLVAAGVVGFDPKGPDTSLVVVRTRFRAWMMVATTLLLEDDANDLVAPQRDDPEVVELVPPAPFEGSATFRRLSPKTATWSGDLAVKLPGLGRTRLSGPSFESALCVESHCTNTASGVVKSLIRLFAAIIALASG